MLAGKSSSLALSMRTRIWFLPGIGWTISSAVGSATRMSKSRKPGAEFGRRVKKRELRVKPILSLKQKSTRTGFYAAGRQQKSQNRAVALRAKRSGRLGGY